MDRVDRILTPIILDAARLVPFQAWLENAETASERKQLIMDARQIGMIDDDQCSRLIEALMLETA